GFPGVQHVEVLEQHRDEADRGEASETGLARERGEAIAGQRRPGHRLVVVPHREQRTGEPVVAQPAVELVELPLRDGPADLVDRPTEAGTGPRPSGDLEGALCQRIPTGELV